MCSTHKRQSPLATRVLPFSDLRLRQVRDVISNIRYFDLALAQRSIIRNCGDEWVQPFFDAYGLPTPDESKLHFFQLLDEFSNARQ